MESTQVDMEQWCERSSYRYCGENVLAYLITAITLHKAAFLARI